MRWNWTDLTKIIEAALAVNDDAPLELAHCSRILLPEVLSSMQPKFIQEAESVLDAFVNRKGKATLRELQGEFVKYEKVLANKQRLYNNAYEKAHREYYKTYTSAAFIALPNLTPYQFGDIDPPFTLKEITIAKAKLDTLIKAGRENLKIIEREWSKDYEKTVEEEVRKKVIQAISYSKLKTKFRELVFLESCVNAKRGRIINAYFEYRHEVTTLFAEALNSMIVINHDLLNEIMRTKAAALRSSVSYEKMSISQMLDCLQALLKEWKLHYETAAKEAHLLAESIE